MDKIVLVDFAGTLIKIDMIDEANELRSKILMKGFPSREEHAHSEKLYKVNREFVEKITGLSSHTKIKYRENNLQMMNLTGENIQNQIAANLFQLGMYMTAKEHKKEMFARHFEEELKRIKKLGYKLAIVSGVRTDIITGVFAIAGFDVEFDYIYGQPPMLGHDQDNDLKDLCKKGKIEFVIGDKMDDLKRFGLEHAKKIFVKWGTPMGGEEDVADYSIESADELEEIIK